MLQKEQKKFANESCSMCGFIQLSMALPCLVGPVWLLIVFDGSHGILWLFYDLLWQNMAYSSSQFIWSCFNKKAKIFQSVYLVLIFNTHARNNDSHIQAKKDSTTIT